MTDLRIEWTYPRHPTLGCRSGVLIGIVFNPQGVPHTYAIDDETGRAVDITHADIRVIRFPRLRRLARVLTSLFKTTEAAR